MASCYSEKLLTAAFKHILRNKKEIERSQQCCCYQCVSIFPAHSVKKWIEEVHDAMPIDPNDWAERGVLSGCCPNCDFDNVIGDASGFPVSDPDFVEEMRKFHWG